MAVEQWSPVEIEGNKEAYFIAASELTLFDQARLAQKTNGSFQSGYFDETSVYYPYDGVGLIFHPRLGFHLLEKGKGEPTTDLAGVTYTDKVAAIPDAMIVHDVDGRVYIVWPIEGDEITDRDFMSITITPGINTKNITYNQSENIGNAQSSIIFEAAKEALERKSAREKPENIILFVA